jgi:phage terminase large subunit-like protein
LNSYHAHIKELLEKHNVIRAKGLGITHIPKVSHPEKAIRAINIAQRMCTHTKGRRWAGVPFQLIKWQWLLFWRLYGTCRSNGRRQYRIVYCEIPKKNGKSELAAVVAIIGLVGDDELGAEVYSAAGDKDQAGLVYNVAAQMVRNNRTLDKRLRILDSRKRIIDYKTNSFYQVLSAEVFTKHGLNPSTVIFDELHAQKTRDLWDVLVEGTDYAREQQIVFCITTAGVYDKNSIGWEMHEYADQVQRGIIKDDSFLPVLFCADKEKDDYEDPKVWRRVNPSIGHIFDLQKIKDDYSKVKHRPARLNNFLRFRLNIWVNQISRWIDMYQWGQCKGKIDKGRLLKRPCFGALDLASKIDLTAFALVFPPVTAEEKWRLLVRCYCPEDTIVQRSKEDKVNYLLWRDAGHLIATSGNVVDYAFIRRDVNKAAEIYDLQEVAYDPWNATQVAVEIDNDDGIPMVEHRQGYASMSEPCKEFERLIIGGDLQHDGNPVLRWCVDNLVITTDAAGNIKPAKDKAREKIDAAVAGIMALGRAIVNFDEPFVYDERGIRTL